MEGIVIGLLGTIATVIVSIATLAYWLGRKFAQIETRLDHLGRGLFNLADAYVGYQEFFVEFLIHESVLRPAARDLLVNEVKRMMKLA
ncbi:MAG: hypothetical protein J7J99_06065, partial [Thermoprotei archaeon]|nr:hypothetical protein [Thermoprotei archaeon]